MALTPREAFKVGFMLRCANEGLDPENTQQRIKEVSTHLEKQALFEGLGQIGSKLTNVGLGLGIGVPVGLGALGGYMLHRAREADVDAEDVRTREMINELKHWTRRAKEKQKSKLLRQSND